MDGRTVGRSVEERYEKDKNEVEDGYEMPKELHDDKSQAEGQ